MFQAYAGGGGVLGEEGLRRFLREVQGLDAAAAEAEAKEVIAFAAEQRLLKKGGGGLTAEGFQRWLCSDANAALDPRRGVSFRLFFFKKYVYVYICFGLSKFKPLKLLSFLLFAIHFYLADVLFYLADVILISNRSSTYALLNFLQQK